MAARIIDGADTDPAPLRLVLGSQVLQATLDALRKRIAGFQAELAASTDFPSGKFSCRQPSVELPGLVRSQRAGQHLASGGDDSTEDL
jgi:hypothetical protein